jgi:hypothetical protein
MLISACNQSISDLEKAREQLSQEGSVFVEDVKTASELAGYSVKIPSYLPEDYELAAFPGGTFQVFKLGDPNISVGTDSVEFPYSVLEYFYKSGTVVPNETFFNIHQSRNKISGPGETPIMINGFQGKKGIFNDASRTMIYITWNDGTTYFVMESWLTDFLDEVTLLKVAASMTDKGS